MLNKIIAFSISNKLLIGLFIFALIGYGSYQFTLLPIDAVPDITDNQVQVITVAPSFGATDIERLVTFPIEQANCNITGLKEIRSFSRFGLSLVTIVFDDATDIYWARQQVAERLQKVQTEIPPGIGVPELGPITTGLGEIYQYMVRAKPGYENRFNETELRTIQDWIVRRQLLGVKGVAEVSSFGGKLKQYSIELDPNKLRSHNITISDVFKALEDNNQNTGGSYIEKGATVLYIRSEGLVGNFDDIKNIRIKSLSNGAPLFIRDVAEVKTGYATRYGAMCYNDKGEVAGAIVMMLKGANSSEVIKKVKERIVQIQKTLPEGVIIEPFLDRTKMVNHAIGTVASNLLEGALIVIFVLVLFLGNMRAGLLVASVIPLSLLFAVIMMNLFGVSGNLMSLGALDFGLIVDGAVIIVEAVMHQLNHNRKYEHHKILTRHEMDASVRHSAGKMMNSAVFGQLIILVVYLPIFSLNGIEGKMFRPMAQTVAFALLGAFILSLTYIPMMSAFILSRKTKHQLNVSDKVMRKVEEIYHRLLNKAMLFPKAIVLSTTVLFIISIVVFGSLGGEFIPTLEEGDFAVDTRVMPGSNLTTTIENTQKAAHILKTKFPEVIKVVTKIGSGEVPTDPMPMEASDMMVILKDKEEWTSAKTFNELAEKMGKALEDLPGVTAGFQFPVQMRFNELMTGARQDVVCKIFGEDLDTLAVYAAQLGQVISTVEGAKNLYVEAVSGFPQVIIFYNRNAIAQYGLNIADINQTVNTALAGRSSGKVFEGEKRFDLVVRLGNQYKTDIKDIQNLLIPTPQGTQVSLRQLADVSIADGPNQIQREDAKRRIVAGFNVRGRDVESIVSELQNKVDAKIKLPPGYYISYGGAFENLNEARQRLRITVPVSLLLIFFLLYFTFNSFRHGLLIYSAIPLSAIGGIFFLSVRGMPFSISAGVGFIVLFGVAVLNGIVLIAEFNRIKNNGESSLKAVVLEGTRIRLRPVLMTAFVASLGFLPMAVSNGAGAEVQRPLATVVIGGLLIATLLTLFVLPVLYLLFETVSAKRNIMKPALSLFIPIMVSACLSSTVNAQQKISLQAAIDTALKNNLAVRNEKLKAAYQQQLTKTSGMIPSTNFLVEAGQFNSNFIDNRFGISQSFSLPQVYSKNKTLLMEEWKSTLASVSVKEAELKREVEETFLMLVYLGEKEALLSKLDTTFSNFLKKANLRLAKGESNILERTMAETQLGNVRLQLQQLIQDKALMNIHFQLLLNTEVVYTPNDLADYFNNTVSSPAASVNEHPLLKVLQQQKLESMAETAVEKAKLLPEISVGYYNTTIRGTGADDKVYNGSSRFNSAQIGVGIPLFTGPQKEKIKAARVNESIVGNKYQIERQQMQKKYEGALVQYQNHRKALDLYEQSLLPNAALITETADKQIFSGEINYLDWVMLVNQAINIQSSYIDAKKLYYQSAILINYLTAK